MSNTKPIEDGMHTVTPHLVCAGAADAIAFYARAFGAEEVMRLPGPGGKLAHAAVRIGNSMVMLTDEFPDWDANSPATLGGTPVTIHLSVDAVDDWFERAVQAGATARMAPADMFWGDRYGVVEDPFGHRWSMATHIRDVSPEEMARAMEQGM
ncbi:MAG: VOC family protein [Pseudomonadota bacterium]